jgi:magnesium transporter
MSVARLSKALLVRHPAEAARILDKHPPEIVAGLLQKHPAEVAADVLEECLPLFAAAFLACLPAETAGEIVELLDGEHAAPILRHIPPIRREEILNALPPSMGSAYRTLLSFPRDCAGANMNPFALVLREDTTIADAMKRVRSLGREAFYFPYIVDQEQRLVGILTVRDLMMAGPKQPLMEVMRRDVLRVPTEATFEEIDRIPGCRAYQSLPVVDVDGVLVGVLPQDSFRAMEKDSGSGKHGIHLAEGLVAVGELFVHSQAALIPLMADAAAAVLTPSKAEGEQRAS